MDLQDESMKDYFKDLEERLAEGRKPHEKLAALLADEFIEFGSSGRIYNKESTIDALKASGNIKVKLMDFDMKLLSPEAVLVTYKALKDTGNSLRSSVWVFREDGWKILFHQGTNI